MTLTNFTPDSAAAAPDAAVEMSEQCAASHGEAARSGDAAPRDGLVDRRAPRGQSGVSAARERRQFGSSHAGLSEGGRELAAAIDRYKLQHHRRYITCDEMLTVLHELGYQRVAEPTCKSGG